MHQDPLTLFDAPFGAILETIFLRFYPLFPFFSSSSGPIFFISLKSLLPYKEVSLESISNCVESKNVSHQTPTKSSMPSALPTSPLI